MKINTVDLFSGCGGMTDGFAQEGHYKVLGCVEWEKPMCETLAHRLLTKWNHANAEKEVIRFDIQRTDELFNGFSDNIYGKHKGLDSLVGKKHVNVIIGGPPCQAYSLAGRIRDEHGMKDDYRNFLFESYIKVVNHYQPDFFVFENVVGMLSAIPTGEPIVNLIHKTFKDAGYITIDNFKDALFDVADFGIPQHRKRVIILGVRENTFGTVSNSIIKDFYAEMMTNCKKKFSTVSDAISDLPEFFPLENPVVINGHKFSHLPAHYDGYLNHVPRYHNQRDINVFRMLADDIKSGRNEYTNIGKLKKLYTEVTGKVSNIHKYYVLRENEPSNTIPAHLFKDGMRHIHPDPEQARSITVREAARLQTFDDDFEFLGGRMYQYKMIGNAVPSRFAKIIAKSLYRIIKKYM